MLYSDDELISEDCLLAIISLLTSSFLLALVSELVFWPMMSFGSEALWLECFVLLLSLLEVWICWSFVGLVLKQVSKLEAGLKGLFWLQACLKVSVTGLFRQACWALA